MDPRARCAVAATTVALACLSLGALPAAQAESRTLTRVAQAHAVVDLGPHPVEGTMHPEWASECGLAPGPGNVNSICVEDNPTDKGSVVTEIRFTYRSSDYPYFPNPFCGVQFHAFGILGGQGKPYNGYANSGCGFGTKITIIKVDPHADHFQPGTYVCGTASYGGTTSDPNCFMIEI